MLLGESVYKVGQKHRLAMPKRFRHDLGDEIILTRGYEGCIIVISRTQWQLLMERVETGSLFDLAVRESARLLFGGASCVSCDVQGRFVLPESLFDHAGIADEVMFVGLGRWVEIWDVKRWQSYQSTLVSQGSEVAQQMIDRPYSKNL